MPTYYVYSEADFPTIDLGALSLGRLIGWVIKSYSYGGISFHDHRRHDDTMNIQLCFFLNAPVFSKSVCNNNLYVRLL